MSFLGTIKSMFGSKKNDPKEQPTENAAGNEAGGQGEYMNVPPPASSSFEAAVLNGTGGTQPSNVAVPVRMPDNTEEKGNTSMIEEIAKDPTQMKAVEEHAAVDGMGNETSALKDIATNPELAKAMAEHAATDGMEDKTSALSEIAKDPTQVDVVKGHAAAVSSSGMTADEILEIWKRDSRGIFKSDFPSSANLSESRGIFTSEPYEKQARRMIDKLAEELKAAQQNDHPSHKELMKVLSKIEVTGVLMRNVLEAADLREYISNSHSELAHDANGMSSPDLGAPSEGDIPTQKFGDDVNLKPKNDFSKNEVDPKKARFFMDRRHPSP